MITINVIPTKKIYDDKDGLNKGFKVYSCTVPKSYIKKTNSPYITISGVTPDLQIGETNTVTIEQIETGKYAGGYKIITYHIKETYNTKKSNKILLEHLGYSEKTISAILDVYPNIAEIVYNNRKHTLDYSKIKGMSKKVFDNIIKNIEGRSKELLLVNTFPKMKLTNAVSNAILKKYSEIDKFKIAFETDPYLALCSVTGIGFKKADEMILSHDETLRNSKYRVLSAIEYVLEQNENNNGSTFMFAGICRQEVQKIVPEAISHFNAVAKENNRFYINTSKSIIARKSTFLTEEKIYKKIKEGTFIKKHFDFNVKNFDKDIEGNTLTEEQTKILDVIKTNSISILCGYAGSGKTTSVNAITQMLKFYNKKFCLLAPTGRASKVLSENTNFDASTIHRKLLHMKKIGDEIFIEDFIIVDEASMIDANLMETLLDKIDFIKTSLIFVCDPAQLASVGAGNVIYELINSKIIPVVTLSKIFRYGEGGISYVATEIRNGVSYFHSGKSDKNSSKLKFGNKEDYVFISSEDDTILSKISKIYQNLILKNKLNLDEIIVLSGFNKGELGTVNLNNLIQKTINNKSKTVCKKMVDNEVVKFKLNDKVIQVKNDYEIQPPLFNGQDGIIKGFDEDNLSLIIEFDKVIYQYPVSKINNLALGYCVTIHKSQGSTFNNVILISPKSQSYFATRNLLYVGVTRARHKVIHIGDYSNVGMALKKEETEKRKTFLNLFFNQDIDITNEV